MMIKKLLITIMALCALQPTFAMESSLVPAQEENSIVHDFLHNHAKFKALWGTPDQRGTTYFKLPKEIAHRIAREALAPALAMLKKSPGLLTTTRKVSKTFFEEPMGYTSRIRWNYHAVHTVDENALPKSSEAHPRSNLAFSALPDGSIKIWNMTTKNPVHILTGHTKPVRNALFDPSGNLLATSSDDTNVKLWNVHSGECLHTFHEFWFKSPLIRFNKNGTLLLIANLDSIDFYDVATRKRLHHMRSGHKLYNISVNDEETYFADLHQRKENQDEFSVSVWDMKKKKLIQQLDTYYCEELDPSDNVFLTKGSHKKLVNLWDVGGYFAAVKFLDNLSLEQALLLNCIAHTMLINKTLRKKHRYEKPEFLENIMRELDFNQFPHLQPYFESLPKEIQHGLQQYVIVRDDEDNSWCSIA